MRLKESKFGRYLNTAKSEKFTFEETIPFTQRLVDIEDDVQQMITSTVFAKIIGVQSATRNFLCVSCYKKVIQKLRCKVGNCQGCNLMQKTSSCKSKWNVRIWFETEEPKRMIRLTIFNIHCLQTLLNLEISSCVLNSTTEEDLTLVLLGFESTYKVTYDNVRNAVLDIEFP